MVSFKKKKKYSKIFSRLYFSYNLLNEYWLRINTEIHMSLISKFQYWIQQFYESFIGQSTDKFIYFSINDTKIISQHQKAFLNQFFDYNQDFLFVAKDIYIQKFLAKQSLRKKYKKSLLDILIINNSKVVFRRDLYTHSIMGQRFCNMFMKKGHFSKILKIFLKLNVYFKMVYGFELIYLLLLLLYLYKIPYSNKLKKKSGKIRNTPTHIGIDRYYVQFFNLFKKAIKKRTELSIFLRLSTEIEALLLTNKISFFFKDFSDLIDYTLSGRTNLLQKKRRVRKFKKFKKYKFKKLPRFLKKQKRLKRRGLKSRVYRKRIRSYIKYSNKVLSNLIKKQKITKKKM